MNPEVKIYDDLTDLVGTITVGNQTYVGTATQPVNVNYINDTMVWSEGQGENATWNFNSGIAWRWTRTGIHHFYGWLTKDPAGLQNNGTGTAATFNESTKVLSVPAIPFTKDTPQFDFSYSDIVTKDVNSGFNAAESVNLPLFHLFSAVGVTFTNNSGRAVDIKEVSFQKMKNGRKADISYAVSTDRVALTDGVQSTFVVWPSVSGQEISIAATNTSAINAYTGTAAAATTEAGDYRLIWPQESLTEVGLYVKYTLDGTECESTFSLASFFDNQMVAGTKYLLGLYLDPKELYIKPIVMPWTIASEYNYESSITTSLRCADASYRGINLSSGWSQSWAEYMAVSYGYINPQNEAVTTPTNEDRPAYASRIELHTVSHSEDLILGLDNDKYKFIVYYEEDYTYVDDQGIAQTGTRYLYNHSYIGGQSISLPAGDNTVYFYVVPVSRFSNDATTADKTCHVYLATVSEELGSIKQPFNYNALPGNSGGSDEIWVYYVSPNAYADDAQTDPYTPGN